MNNIANINTTYKKRHNSYRVDQKSKPRSRIITIS